tara:strand:+ start:6137 stop:6586 length:450 start_codon:yes stop_codon:yes gene_type:complete
MVQQSRSEKRRLRRSRRKRLGLPETLMEIFAMPLIFILASNPQFDMKDWRPPIFDEESIDPQPAPSPQVAPHQLVICEDGKLISDGKESSIETLIGDINQTIEPNQGIRLIVESSENGVGNVNAFLQVQAVLSQTEMWSRTRIPHLTPE